MRRTLPVVFAILCSSLLPSPVVAQEPRPPASGARLWEYGVLESSQTGRGDAFVFCRFTSEGCQETTLESKPLPDPRQRPQVSERQGDYDLVSARAIARLGLEGWELVTETQFARYGNAPVLLFKRAAGAR